MSCCHSLASSAYSLIYLLNLRKVKHVPENPSNDDFAVKPRQTSISGSSKDSLTGSEPPRPGTPGLSNKNTMLKSRQPVTLGSSDDRAAPEQRPSSVSEPCRDFSSLKTCRPVAAESSNDNATPETQNPSVFGTRKDYVIPEPHHFAACGPFDRIPLEIIHEIASWLPLSSAANLTLCNRKLKHILGNRYLLALRPDGSSKYERNLFLRGLDRHSPETFLCYGCSKLHPLAPIDEDRLTPEARFKWVSEFRCLSRNDTDKLLYTYVITFHYHAQFRFEHIQVAMKLHRLGLVSDAKAYLECSALKEPIRRKMTVYDPSNMGYYFFEPRIVKDQVFARAQSWISIPKEQDLLIYRRTHLHRNLLCVHLDVDFMGVGGDRFAMILQCILEQLRGKQESCGQCQTLIRCHYCPTEVLVETKRSDLQVEGDMVVITKWQALGYGVSPYEPQWESHFQPRPPWPWPPGSTPGSIREAFENQPGVKYDSIFDAEREWKFLKEKKSSGRR